MRYIERINDSHNGEFVPISDIWEETLYQEDIGKKWFREWTIDQKYQLLGFTEGKNTDYDAEVLQDNVIYTYELKSEFRAIDYKTSFVEYLENDKPSGLSLTKSDYYYFLTGSKGTPKQPYLVPTDVLKRLGHSLPDASKGIKGGLNNTATGFRLPLLLIEDYKL